MKAIIVWIRVSTRIKSRVCSRNDLRSFDGHLNRFFSAVTLGHRGNRSYLEADYSCCPSWRSKKKKLTFLRATFLSIETFQNVPLRIMHFYNYWYISSIWSKVSWCKHTDDEDPWWNSFYTFWHFFSTLQTYGCLFSDTWNNSFSAECSFRQKHSNHWYQYSVWIILKTSEFDYYSLK